MVDDADDIERDEIQTMIPSTQEDENGGVDSTRLSSLSHHNKPSKKKRIGSLSTSFCFLLVIAIFSATIAVLPRDVCVHGLTPASRPNRSRNSASKRSSNNNSNRQSKKSNLSASNLSLDRVHNNNRIPRQHQANNSNHQRQRPQQQRQHQNHRSSSSAAASAATAVPSIFVKNLAYQATREDIIRACEKHYGPVESVWIPTGNDKKGYASIVFEEANVAHRALKAGRLEVLGRGAYLVENTRPPDPRGDAFRFLAAFSRGDARLENPSPTKVRREVGAAGNPRNVKERGILAAALARMGARDELLEILGGGKSNPRLQQQLPNTPSTASTSVYNAALSALTVSNSRECLLVKELVAMAEDGPGVNARTYATAIGSIKRGASNSAAIAVDDFRELCGAASRFLHKARSNGVANHVVYNELISCLGKMPGSSDTSAAATTTTIEESTPDDDFSSPACYTCEASWKMATDVLHEMFEDDAVEPTEVSLNAAIASCAAAGQIDAALSIYDKGFRKAGAEVEPSMVTTNSMLSTVHKWIKKRRHTSSSSTASTTTALDPADAQKALGFVDKVVADAVSRGDDLEEDVITTNALVSVYGAAGDTARALQLWEKARRSGQATTVTANAALAALALEGKVAEAVELVGSLDSSQTKSDTTSWNTALSACGQSGDSDTALRLLREMPHQPDARTFVAVLSSFTESDDATHIKDLLVKADTAKAITTYVLNAALAACDRLGETILAQKIFQQGFRARDLEPDVISYNTMLQILGRTDPDTALGLLETMSQDSPKTPRPDEQSYCSVIAALSSGQRHQQALEMLDRLPRTFRRSLPIHKEALRACYAASDPDAALSLLDKMTEEGPNPDTVATTLILNTCARTGQPEHCKAGLALANELLESKDADAIAFNSAIALAEKSGDSDAALGFLEKLTHSKHAQPDAVSYCSAIASCETSSASSNGMPLVDRALELYHQSLATVGPDAGCTIATVQTLVAAGSNAHLDKALVLLQDPAVSGFDDQSRYVLYRSVQVACAAAGLQRDADALSQRIKRENLTALAPLARTTVGGKSAEFDNHIELPGDHDANTRDGIGEADVANTVQSMVSDMKHDFVTSALPLEFRTNAPLKTQEVSLANHAEKKALARLLIEEARNADLVQAEAPPLAISINFKMCADCHAFFKGASKLLEGRRITVREPTMVHVFEDGACSCGDQWRWEARHGNQNDNALLQPAAVATTNTNRFGRLPPRLKP